VTPAALRQKPVHRWFVLAHSFTSELVHALVKEWEIGPSQCVLDPFLGAGTTVVAAQELGIPAYGFDLSPLAVFASRVKAGTRDLDLGRIEAAWGALRLRLMRLTPCPPRREYAPLVKRALAGAALGLCEAVALEIDGLQCREIERDFFRLALLSTLPRHSTALATGGWLKWAESERSGEQVSRTFTNLVEVMLEDLRQRMPTSPIPAWTIGKADARRLPLPDACVDAVITSPPYPNRHDYTRVYGIELLFGFLDWEGARSLRYQSFHSHPEARPDRPPAPDYSPPRSLCAVTAYLRAHECDLRIPRMLDGYFLDMHICLREVARVCVPGARVALVLGNAQYLGQPVAVDELTAEVGEQAGLQCKGFMVARTRGNSAQQMKQFGIRPSRETVVLFMKSGLP
jgi:hypothetical protein